MLTVAVAVAVTEGVSAQDAAGHGAPEWVISESQISRGLQPAGQRHGRSCRPSPGNWGMSFSLHCRQGRTEAMFVIPDFIRFPAGASFPVGYLTVSPEALRSRSVERRWVERRGVEKGWDELSSSVPTPPSRGMPWVF